VVCNESMDRQGWGGWAGAPDLDPGLRDATYASLAGWRRRLEGSRGLSSPTASRQELAIIGKEAGDLRTLALARGANALAQHLEGIATAVSGPPGALAEALERLAQHMAPTEPRLVHSVMQPSLVEPPLLDVSQARPLVTGGKPIPEGTLLSGRLPGRPAQGGDSTPPQVAPPPPISPVPPRPRSVAPVRLPDSVAPPQPQPSFVGTFLGFRAFGRKAPDASGPLPAASAKPSTDVLGLRGRPRAPSNPVLPAFQAPRQPFPDLPGAEPPRWGDRPAADVSTARRRRKPSRTSAGEPPLPGWFYAVGGGLGVLVIATILIIVRSVHGSNLLPTPAPKPASTDVSTVPTGPATGGNPADTSNPANQGPTAGTASGDAIIATFQPRGKETPELKALLETQSHLAQACRSDPASCGRGWTPLSRDAFNPIDRSSLQLEPPPATPLPAWLQRLKLPAELPVRDDNSLRAMFDFNTKNIAGRQRFQAKLFECAAYDDIFDSTLVKYGAPSWLAAVVFQESGCYPRARSEVGAVGLWQFMPESARAYGLRVVDGEIDERLNPIKATDAAIHFLTDLQRTLGAWDLVLAAYNMGPYAVLARLAQVGNSAGFWELAHAGLLPEETAGYVPAIEAYALALQNLSRLQFSRDGKRLEATAEISVKPGYRLSLLARAASTTTLHIRELNPEFLRDVVPEGETTARVPDAESRRAQAFLESWSPDDNRDTCVPEDFDWGVREFESSKFAKGCGQQANP
jgi:Transglycosylase SLT domain